MIPSILTRWWGRQRLVSRLAFVLVGAGLVMAALSWGALRLRLVPAFAAIETRVNDAQLQRARVSLDALGQRLTGEALDYAVWDDAYSYVAGKNPDFEAVTLTPMAFRYMNIDMLAVVRFDGRVVISRVVDPENGRLLEDEGRHFGKLLSGPRLFDYFRGKDKALTYVRTSRGIYAVAGAWVRQSDGSGAVEGFLVKGRLLRTKKLGDALQADVRLALDPDSEMKAQLARGQGIFTRIRDGRIENAIGLSDLEGHVLAAIVFLTEREISAAGEQAIGSAATVMMLNFALLIGVLGIAFNRIGVRRLGRLSVQIGAFRESRAGIDEALLDGRDEIATLARQFDRLFDSLIDAEEQLRHRSYLQGRADSASGLLHNVRNALAPLTVTFEKWLREEQLPYRANLRRALEAIEDPDCDEERRRELLRFILAAGRKMLAQSDGRIAELSEARDAVDQIGRILSSEEEENGATPVDERIDLEALVQREARQLSLRFAGLVDIALPRSIPPVLGNHIQLSQVLTNLLVNAAESMQAANVPRMRIDVDVSRDPMAGMVTLRIRDHGEGADPKVLASVFERGFSTRSYKTGGIGLHWCAIAVRAMGGSLALVSDGPGTGATAVLTLRDANAASLEAGKELPAAA